MGSLEWERVLRFLVILIGAGRLQVAICQDDQTFVAAIVRSMMLAERPGRITPRVSKCYPEIGCFSDSGLFAKIRKNPHNVRTRFSLYSKANLRGVHAEFRDDMRELIEHVDDDKPILILVHGVGQAPSDWPLIVKSNVLKGLDRSVLVVDWSQNGEESFMDFDYGQAVANALLVGRQIAVVIKKFLAKKNLLTLKNVKTAHIHYVGFSEGAQMATSFVEHLYELTGMSIYRVTALDPSAPFFETFNKSISRATAKYVDVVHTAAGLTSPGFYQHVRVGQIGVMRPLGHMDVYFNGGTNQPGCGIVQDMLCSHRRAFEYIMFATDSRTPCVFNMYNCTDNTPLGSMCQKMVLADFYSLEWALKKEPRGIRVAKVFRTPPFCE